MDPAKDEDFLYWVVDQVKALARDPKFMADFKKWQTEREGKDSSSLCSSG